MNWKRLLRSTPREREEFLGQVWGGLFVGVVVILTVTIVGKACLFPG